MLQSLYIDSVKTVRLPLIPILKGCYLACFVHQRAALSYYSDLQLVASISCLSIKASRAVEKKRHIVPFSSSTCCTSHTHTQKNKTSWWSTWHKVWNIELPTELTHCPALTNLSPTVKVLLLNTHTQNQMSQRKLLYLEHFRSDLPSVTRWDFCLISMSIHLFLSSLNSICHVVFRLGKWRRESVVVEPGWLPAPPEVSHPGCEPVSKWSCFLVWPQGVPTASS